MTAKTATSILTEFCAQEKVAPPTYEPVTNDSDPSVFLVLAKAFDLIGKGYGRTKKDAKQAASKQLLDRLSQIDKYRNKLKVESLQPLAPLEPTQPTADNFFGEILTLCMKHGLTTPAIDEISVTGAGSHRPEFTFRCRLGRIEKFGVGPTKKEAKRKASEEMLMHLKVSLVDDSTSCDSSSICSNETVPDVLPLLELPTVEETLAEYRRLRKPYIQPAVDGLRYRKDFFIKLPADDRRRAQKILNNRGGVLSDRDIVDQVCKALNLKYEFKAMSTPINYRRFSLVDSKYDCVLIEHSDRLCGRIIEYFKTMLNMQKLTDRRQIINDEENNNFYN